MSQETGTEVSERYVSGGPGEELAAPSLAAAVKLTVDRIGDDPAICGDDGLTLTWNEMWAKASRVAGGLASLGISTGDTVALMLNNRPEFIPCDLGAVVLGAVPFSIYQTSSPEQIQYVCSDAAARVAIVERAYLDTFMVARTDLPELEHVITLDGEGGTMTLEALEAIDPTFDPTESIAAIDPDDLLTLIYTSGTTGPPKGVQLTHRNLMALTSGVEGMIDLPERGGKVISWLPAAHIAERGANYYLPTIRGLTIHVCSDPRKIIEVLPTVRPTWFFAVPRIWEKLKAGLEAKIAAMPDQAREMAEGAIDAAVKQVELRQAGSPVPQELAAAVAQADLAMFAPIRAQLGLDEAVAVNVGAAPTPFEVLRFFHAIGLEIGELWGMSETCGVATLNPPNRVKLGTVGPPVAGCELKLGEDGEVFVRGDAVMAGYRNMPEKTAEAIDSEGWLATGDIGALDADGYLKIVDRKKELIINAAGKNMSPAGIEAKIKAADSLIGQCIAIGDARPYNVALIVLDPEVAPVWAAKQGIDGDLAAIAASDAAKAAVGAAVEAANQRMSRVEQIKRFEILATDWLPGGDELTPTMKLKRKPIGEKYAAEIESLYVR